MFLETCLSGAQRSADRQRWSATWTRNPWNVERSFALAPRSTTQPASCWLRPTIPSGRKPWHLMTRHRGRRIRPRPKNTFDPLNIGGSRESSDWSNAADAANEFAGPAGRWEWALPSWQAFSGARIPNVVHRISAKTPQESSRQSARRGRRRRRTDRRSSTQVPISLAVGRGRPTARRRGRGAPMRVFALASDVDDPAPCRAWMRGGPTPWRRGSRIEHAANERRAACRANVHRISVLRPVVAVVRPSRRRGEEHSDYRASTSTTRHPVCVDARDCCTSN